MNRQLAIPLLFLSLGTCNATPSPQNSQAVQSAVSQKEIQQRQEAEKQLHTAEGKWNEKKTTHYSYILQHSCFCTVEHNSPIDISVRDNVIQKAVMHQNNQPLPSAHMDEALTIKDLFNLIHKAIDKKAAKIDVKYDRVYGYPTSIAIDWNTMLADEETYLIAKDLHPL